MLAARFSNEVAARLLGLLSLGIFLACAMAMNCQPSLADDAATENAATDDAATENAAPAAAASAQAEAATTETSEEAQGYVDQLDAEVFGDRQAASQGLAKLGKAAVPALEKAIEAGSTEAASRSFELLQRLFEKGDDATQQAARATLDRLAKNPGPIGQHAKQLLSPIKPVEEAAPVPGPFGAPRLRLGGGGIAPIPVVAAPVVNRRSMKVSNNNGVKTIEAEVNDDKVKIVDDPERGIKMEIIKNKDGKETTEKFAAKNAEELKTNHPEAFKVYEHHTKKAFGNIRAEVNVGGPAPPLAVQDNLKAAIKRLEQEIEETKNNVALPEDFRKKHLENIERHRDRLKESLK